MRIKTHLDNNIYLSLQCSVLRSDQDCNQSYRVTVKLKLILTSHFSGVERTASRGRLEMTGGGSLTR